MRVACGIGNKLICGAVFLSMPGEPPLRLSGEFIMLSQDAMNAILSLPQGDSQIILRAKGIAKAAFPDRVYENEPTDTTATGRHQSLLSFMGKLRIKPVTAGDSWQPPTIQELIEAGMWFGTEWCVPAIPEQELRKFVEQKAYAYGEEKAIINAVQEAHVTDLRLSDDEVDINELMRNTVVSSVKNAKDTKTTKTSIYDFFSKCDKVPAAIKKLRKIQNTEAYQNAKTTTLAGATISSLYKDGRSKADSVFSGFYFGDIDKVPVDEVQNVYNELYAQDGVIGVAISSSGKGIRALLYVKDGDIHSIHKEFLRLANNLISVKRIKQTYNDFKVDNAMNTINQLSFIVSNFKYKEKSKIYVPIVTTTEKQDTPVSLFADYTDAEKAKLKELVKNRKKKTTNLPGLVNKERTVLKGKLKVDVRALKAAKNIEKQLVTEEVAEYIARTAVDSVDFVVQPGDMVDTSAGGKLLNIPLTDDSVLEQALLNRIYLRQQQAKFFDNHPNCGIPLCDRVVDDKHHDTVANAVLKIIDDQGSRIVVYNEVIYVYYNNRYMMFSEDMFAAHIATNYLKYLVTISYTQIEDKEGNLKTVPCLSPLQLSPSVEKQTLNRIRQLCIVDKNPRYSSRLTDINEVFSLLDNEQAGCVWLGDQECPFDIENTLFCPSFGYNILTGERITYTRDMFCTAYLGVDVDETKTDTPGLDKILNDQFGDEPDTINLFYECAGYLVAPSKRREVIVVLLGDKRTGKSTLADALFNVVGNSQNIDENTFKSEHGTQGIVNARLLLSMESRTISRTTESAMKSISGNDPILVNRKFKGITSQRVPGKILIVNNEMPSISDPYLVSRMENTCITFKHSFFGKEDHYLKERIMKNELQAFLNKCIAGYRRLVNNNFVFTDTKNSRNTRQKLSNDNFSYEMYLENCCEYNESEGISSIALYSDYCEWFRLNYTDPLIKPVGMNKFITTLLKNNTNVIKSRRTINGKAVMWLQGVTTTVDITAGTIDEGLEVSNDVQSENIDAMHEERTGGSCELGNGGDVREQSTTTSDSDGDRQKGTELPNYLLQDMEKRNDDNIDEPITKVSKRQSRRNVQRMQEDKRLSVSSNDCTGVSKNGGTGSPSNTESTCVTDTGKTAETCYDKRKDSRQVQKGGKVVQRTPNGNGKGKSANKK